MSDSTSETVSTGDARVDAVVARLGSLGDLDLPEQLEVFADMHGALAAVLDDDEGVVGTTSA